MSTTEEATVNPDGSTTFSSEEGGDAGASGYDSYTTVMSPGTSLRA